MKKSISFFFMAALFALPAFAENPETEHVTHELWPSTNHDCDGHFDLGQFGFSLPEIAPRTRKFAAKINYEPTEGPDLPGRERVVISYRFVGKHCIKNEKPLQSGVDHYEFRSQEIPGSIWVKVPGAESAFRSDFFNSIEPVLPREKSGNVTNAEISLPIMSMLTPEQLDLIWAGHPQKVTFEASLSFQHEFKKQMKSYSNFEVLTAIFSLDEATDEISVTLLN